MASTAFLLMCSLLFCIVSGDVTSICNSSSPDPDDPPLPQLPNQYYLAMEATLVERNMSVFATEYFDGPGDRGRIEINRGGIRVQSVVDYNLREAFVFPNQRTGDACTVSILTTNTTNRAVRFTFGIQPGENNTVHIGSPSLFFGLDNVTNSDYLGIEAIRGIPCYHWQTCYNSPNLSFSLDYYFTDSSLWTSAYPDSNTSVPVLIELNGRIMNRSTGEEYSTQHYYSVVGFNSGPDSVPDDAFNIPLDLVCKGRLPGQPLPQLPDAFSTSFEVVSDSNTTVWREYYDYVHQLFRVDGSINQTGGFALIHDFTIGLQYFMSPSTGSCFLQRLNSTNTRYDGVNGSDGHLQLQTAQTLFAAQSQYQFVYEGVTTVRGMTVDVWQSYRDQETFYSTINFTNIVYLVYMTRPGRLMQTEYGSTTDPVVVQASFSGTWNTLLPNGTVNMTNITSTTNVFGFIPIEPPLDVYSTLSCLPQSDYEMVRFRVPKSVNPFGRSKFRADIRSAFMDYARSINMPFVTALQINNIQIDTVSIPNFVLVTVYITNLPRIAPVTWSYTPQAFVNTLTSGLANNSRLPFTIRFSGSTGAAADEVNPLFVATPVAEDCSGTAPIGLAIGIAVVVLILGLAVGVIVGVVLCVVVRRCRNNAGFNLSQEPTSKYERQVDDEMKDPTS